MIGDDLDAAIDELRLEAVSAMADTFTAYAPTWGKVNRLDQLVDGDPLGATVGKVQGTSVTGRDSVTRTLTIGDARVPVIEGGLQIPVDSFITDGVLDIVASDQRGTAWEFVCTAVGPNSDPALLGRRYMVVNVPVKSRATARRMDVVEVPTS